MVGKEATACALIAMCLALGATASVHAATDPLASATSGNVDIGRPAVAEPKPQRMRLRSARRPVRHRVARRGARLVPDVARPAILGVDVLAPAVRDYPPLAPEPRDNAAALTPAFYLGGLARFVTQPPPPLECRPQRRDDIGLPGYLPGAPLYCAQVDP